MDAEGPVGGSGAATGFTLLEVLIAFIIAALGIAALLQGASGGLQGAQAAAHYEEALSRAQSRLALLQSFQPGEQRGDDGGGFTWRVLVQPGGSTPAPVSARPPARGAPPPGAATRELPDAAALRLVLYAVDVSILWQLDGSPRQVTLRSQRLGLAAADGP